MRRSSLDAAAYVRGAVWGRLAGRRSRCVGRSLLDDAAAGVPRVAVEQDEAEREDMYEKAGFRSFMELGSFDFCGEDGGFGLVDVD